MKHYVKLSTYSVILTSCLLIISGGVAIYMLENDCPWDIWVLLCALIALMGVSALIYMPVSISVNEKELCINRPLKTKHIMLDDIKSIALVKPTMGAKRICGSGGWFGYWGWFSERDLGKYFAYYGMASDCFIVRLKNGRQYMLGCKNPQQITEYLNDKLKR